MVDTSLSCVFQERRLSKTNYSFDLNTVFWDVTVS